MPVLIPVKTLKNHDLLPNVVIPRIAAGGLVRSMTSLGHFAGSLRLLFASVKLNPGA
jgi:hypothetical protein